jgi:hypothetical protein
MIFENLVLQALWVHASTFVEITAEIWGGGERGEDDNPLVLYPKHAQRPRRDLSGLALTGYIRAQPQ